MTAAVQAMLEQAKALTADERLELAHELIASVHPESAEWTATIRRRVEEMRSGAVVGRPADEVANEIRAKLAHTRGR